MPDNSVLNRIKTIQRRLGVEDDGIIGAATLTAIERLLPNDSTVAVYDLMCSHHGLSKLISFEISSESYYQRFLQQPTWPGGSSGITIGIGYDLGYHNPTQIRKDWQNTIPDKDLDKLISVAGLKSEDAKKALRRVNMIKIPLAIAQSVFYIAVLPRFAADTRKAFPGVEALPADAQTALLSLVFNRGTKMTGSRRREMAAIRPRVLAVDLPGIAAQIRAMKRLWENTPLSGLIVRREEEALLLEQAEHPYDQAELIYI